MQFLSMMIKGCIIKGNPVATAQNSDVIALAAYNMHRANCRIVLNFNVATPEAPHVTFDEAPHVTFDDVLNEFAVIRQNASRNTAQTITGQISIKIKYRDENNYICEEDTFLEVDGLDSFNRVLKYLEDIPRKYPFIPNSPNSMSDRLSY